jgi:bifunctional non-homologous end joining protein LigD
VTWDEVAACERREDLVFTSGDVLDRVAGHGDLLAPLVGAQPGQSPRPGS